MVADNAPTQIAPTPDRTAEPLDMACTAWAQPHAIPISHKFAFNIPLPETRLSLDGRRSIDEARLGEERRQALGKLPPQRRERRPVSPPQRRGRRLRQVRPGRRGEPSAVVLGKPRFASP